MISKKKRDVKFMIYLGLYLFVIAFITSQGATLMDIGAEEPAGIIEDTLISKTVLDSLKKLSVYNKETDTVLRKSKNESERYEILSSDETKVKIGILENKEKEINNLRAELSRRPPATKKDGTKKNPTTEFEGGTIKPK